MELRPTQPGATIQTTIGSPYGICGGGGVMDIDPDAQYPDTDGLAAARAAVGDEVVSFMWGRPSDQGSANATFVVECGHGGVTADVSIPPTVQRALQAGGDLKFLSGDGTTGTMHFGVVPPATAAPLPSRALRPLSRRTDLSCGPF
jgi:hypothetical protein